MPRPLDESDEYCPNCGQYTGGEAECQNCGAILKKRSESNDEFEGFHEDDGSFDDDDDIN